ncbi:MAG: carboxypeptidase-like regulatory domain-containing protein, partial [Treponema sp.]|nr:carboxypeptidase-like regulatory domain-containing protein [Treponema sp.]
MLFLSSAVMVSAQSQKVDISLKNATLKQVFSVIENQTTYRFSYRNDVVDDRHDITIDRKGATVEQVLAEALAGRNLDYAIVSQKSIVISDRQQELSPQQGILRHSMTGVVLDENGEAIIGAGIYEKGTKNGTVTDMDGRFEITVAPNAVLTISYIGFMSVDVRAQQGMRVVMREDQTALDEVVVVGYGTMRKRDLTGAISSVNGDDIAVGGAASAAHSLAGKAAGLYVRQNSAQPGGGLDILVRGAGSVNAANDPLYIVDGFPIAKLDQTKGNNQRMDPGTQGILNFL